MNNTPGANNRRDSGRRFPLASAKFAGALRRGRTMPWKKIRTIWTRPATHAVLRSLVHTNHDVCSMSTGPHEGHVVLANLNLQAALADNRASWPGEPISATCSCMQTPHGVHPMSNATPASSHMSAPWTQHRKSSEVHCCLRQR